MTPPLEHRTGSRPRPRHNSPRSRAPPELRVRAGFFAWAEARRPAEGAAERRRARRRGCPDEGCLTVSRRSAQGPPRSALTPRARPARPRALLRCRPHASYSGLPRSL